MRKLRAILFLIWMYGLMLVLGILSLPFLFLPVRWVLWPVQLWLSLVFGGLRVLLGITFEIKGQQNIPKGGALIAGKHQAMFDVLIPWKLFSFPAIILKQELSWMPIFGWYAMKLKNVAIDRKAGAKALRKMLAQTKVLAEQGRQIIIFPEGTRVQPGDKAPYKPGIAAMYGQMNVPCVPVAINSGLCWPAHGLGFKPGMITVQILPVIAPGLSRKQFMQELELRIETASNALLPPKQSPQNRKTP